MLMVRIRFKFQEEAGFSSPEKGFLVVNFVR